MYLSIGKSTVVREKDIIGIFDLDNCSQSRLTRDTLSAAEKRGELINAAEDIPNSFLICKEREETRIILSQSTSRTLEKRMTQMQTERRNTWRKSMN